MKQSKTNYFFFLAFCSLLFAACGGEKRAEPLQETQIKSADSKEANKVAEAIPKPEDGPAIAILSSPKYVAKIHKAIAFTPKNDGAGMMKVKQGHRFVVLDMSIKHTGSELIEMGQILLSVDVKDEKGARYPLNAMAIAAYSYNFPNPGHQAQYEAMWGTMKPGDFFRTTVYGFEAPNGKSHFTISMKEEAIFNSDAKKVEAKFSL